MPLQSWQDRLLKDLCNGQAVSLGLAWPVGATVQMGHRREHIKGVATLRCQTWIGGGRAVKVQAKVTREVMALEDVVQQFLVAWT